MQGLARQEMVGVETARIRIGKIERRPECGLANVVHSVVGKEFSQGDQEETDSEIGKNPGETGVPETRSRC